MEATAPHVSDEPRFLLSATFHCSVTITNGIKDKKYMSVILP